MAAVGAESAYARLERELCARPRRWLVTGAAGFIGSHLVQRLLELGQEVSGLDDLSTGCQRNLDAVAQAVGAGWGRFRFLRGDVRDAALVRAACAGCERVLHQAGLGSVPRSLVEPERCLSVNAQGTWVVLAAAREAGARSVVLASSSSVYGDRLDSPQVEDRVGRALSPYAASKQVAELACAGFSRAHAFPSVALRYFNVFGPRQDPEGPYAAVIPRWVARLLAGAAPVLEGDGAQTRDFTPVASVVQANLLAACTAIPDPAAVLNVGMGRETSLLELFHLLVGICDEMGLGGGLSRPLEAPERSGDRRSSRADLTRARSWLGFQPSVGLRDGLRATVKELVDSSLSAS